MGFSLETAADARITTDRCFRTSGIAMKKIPEMAGVLVRHGVMDRNGGR
jgi:hypothetical protein